MCRYWPNHYKTRALLYKISTHAFVLIFAHTYTLVKNVCMMQFNIVRYFFYREIKESFHATCYRVLVHHLQLHVSYFGMPLSCSKNFV